MAKRDEIFRSFIEHELLQEKYKFTLDSNMTLEEGLNSKIPIINVIAQIVEVSEIKHKHVSDRVLRTSIIQYLKTNAI